MRDEAAGAWQACLRRPGRNAEAIAKCNVERRERGDWWEVLEEMWCCFVGLRMMRLYPRCKGPAYDGEAVIGWRMKILKIDITYGRKDLEISS